MSPSNLSFFLALPSFHLSHLSPNILFFLFSVPNYRQQHVFFHSITAPIVDPSMSTSDPVDPSAHSAIMPMAKKHQQSSDMAAVSPPSTSWSEKVENLIALSRQLFQSPICHSAPENSTVDIDRKYESTSYPACSRLLMKNTLQEKSMEKALKRNSAYKERVIIKQITREREIRIARTSATSTQPLQAVPFSRIVIFMRKSHRLCRACGGIPTSQKASPPNICWGCSRAFICFLCAEIGGADNASSSKGSCLSCGRVLHSQKTPRVTVCATCNRTFACFKCMMPIQFFNFVIM